MSLARTLREIGCTYRQLDYWIRVGLLDTLPPHQRSEPTPGSGHARSLTQAEINLLRQVEALRRAGVSLSAIRSSVVRYGSLRPLIEDLIDTLAHEFASHVVKQTRTLVSV